MAKIFSKNPQFNGVRFGVAFNQGVAETDDKKALAFFKSRDGYQIGKPFDAPEAAKRQDNELEKLTLPELRARAKPLGIEGYATMSKDDLVKALSK